MIHLVHALTPWGVTSMLAERDSASCQNRIVVPNKYPVEGYYRSKLFIPSANTTNPLVAAANPLLSLLERLCCSSILPPINHLRCNIEHELHAFYSSLKRQDYTEEQVVIAYYLLSATTDELLGKNYLRVYHRPAEFTAFTPLSPTDELGPQQRFFDIIRHIKEQPTDYLDLIELAYFCLIAGFEGEQHLHADGRQNLDNLIEDLYHLIQQNRVNKPHLLFTKASPITPATTNKKPLILTAFITFGLLATTYFASYVHLEYKAKALLKHHTAQLTSDS